VSASGDVGTSYTGMVSVCVTLPTGYTCDQGWSVLPGAVLKVDPLMNTAVYSFTVQSAIFPGGTLTASVELAATGDTQLSYSLPWSAARYRAAQLVSGTLSSSTLLPSGRAFADGNGTVAEVYSPPFPIVG